MEQILESVGYITVVVLAATGAIVFVTCAWRGAKVYAAEIDVARQQREEILGLKGGVSVGTKGAQSIILVGEAN